MKNQYYELDESEQYFKGQKNYFFQYYEDLINELKMIEKNQDD